jgi:hypothetical protein
MEFTINGKKIVVTKVRHTGHSVSDRIHWHATCDQQMTEKDIGEAQMLADYHPHGYGINRIHIAPDATGLLWHADWTCSACCD